MANNAFTRFPPQRKSRQQRALRSSHPHGAMSTTSKAFDAAAELSRNDKSGKTSTEDMLRGYGLYKVVMTGVGVCPLHTARTATSHDAPPPASQALTRTIVRAS